MLLGSKKYQKHVSLLLCTFQELMISDVSKIIVYYYHALLNKHAEIILKYPALLDFYFGVDERSLGLIERDPSNRKKIHIFCEEFNMVSKTSYKKGDDIYKRKCLECGTWSTEKYNKTGLVYMCSYPLCAKTRIGCDEPHCCYETQEDLEEDKEVKCKYVPTSEMLIMKKGHIMPGYKKLGNFRNYKK